jgi:hypothetical protein
MLKRAILVGLLLIAPLTAIAQQPLRSNSAARLVTPPEPESQPDSEPLAQPTSQTKGEVDRATPTQSIEKPTQIDTRGTEQAPLAVRIIPAPVTAAESSKEAQERQEKTAIYLWMIALTVAVASLMLFQLFALLTMIATTRRQLRAYVFVSRAEIVDLELGAVPIVQIDIKNTGQTPAYNVVHVWRCGSFAYPLTEKLRLPRQGEPISWAHLGPGAIAKCHRTAEKQIGHGATIELSNRPMAFFVYGEIIYKDAFNKTRFTRYVFFQDGIPRMGPGQLIAHAKGNEAN